MSGSLPEPEHERDKPPAGDQGRRLRLLAEGIACLNAKQFERAQRLAGQAVSIDAHDPDAWHLLGVALAGQGQHARAADAIARAITLNPTSAQFHANLGNTQFQQAEYAKAINSYCRALELDPSYESTQGLLATACGRQLDLGIEHHRGNRFAEARACYESVLRGLPKRADALHLLGMLAYERRDYATATALLTQAIAVNPSVSAFRSSMGTVQRAQGHHTEALAAYEAALLLEPNSALNLYYVALCHYALRHYSAARQAVSSSIALDAKIAASHNLLGQIHRNLGRSREAIASFRRGLEQEPANATLHSNLLFSLNYQHDASPASVFGEHVEWSRRHGRGERTRMPPWSGRLETERVLRVAYVSADLRSHSVAYFLEPVLEARDRTAIHVTCYANRTGRDATTNRLRALSDEWRVIDGVNDDDALTLIRNDEIDILVDLSGHTGRNRMPLFAHRAAPIQVTYIGYPNTTGLATMDYRLTDAWADPVGLADRLNTEELVRLDGGYLCYRPPADSPAVGEPPVLTSGRITFGSFNNLAKVNPALIARWVSILNGVPGSRLMLKTKPLADEGARDLVLQTFAQNGIAPDRLVLSGWTEDTASHLARYSDIDIALDTFPYHGTTTTCEALWMGVPVVTCAGEVHASRVGVSLLTGIELDELVASSMDGYVEAAISLSHDVPRLCRLRADLRARMMTSAITDKTRIAREVERAYRTMWARFVEQMRSHQIRRLAHMRSGKSQMEGSGTPVALPALDVEQTLEAAAKHHREGQLVQAEALYRRILQEQPRHFDSLHMLGLIASQRGHHADAVAQIDAALEIKPDAPNALNNRAMALKGLGRLGDALESLDRAIAFRPGYADAFNNRGIVLKELRRVDDALASFERAIAINPRYAEAHNNRGNALRDINRLDEAIADFDAAIQIKRNYPNAFNNRGVALKDLGRLEEALASHDQAIALKPDYAEAFYNRGTVLVELNRDEDAISSYDRAITLKRNYADAFNGRGIVLKKLGRFEDALESCDRAIAFRPDFTAAFNDRGTILAELRRLDDAVASFDHAIALKPDHLSAIINRGYVLLELGRHNEALASYDRAITLDARNHRAHNNKGVTLTKLRRFEQAIASYDDAIAVKSDYPEAFNNRGYALSELNRNEDAISSYDQAIAHKPDYHEAFNNRGIALMALRRLDEGLQSIDRAIAIEPDYTEGYLNRGNALVELERPDDAIASFDRLLALRPGFADALLNRATAKLLSGRFEDGWKDYEARWDTTNFPSKRPSLQAPLWRGEDLTGRRIAVFTEQGLGDSIQFARYTRSLVERGAIVTLLSPANLHRLLQGLDPSIEVSESPRGMSFDFQCPLMSLPFLLGTNERSIPNCVPYLQADDDRVAHWARMIGDHGFKVGIAWQGRPNRSLDRGRSIPLAEYAPLARVPGVRLISLQKSEGLDQLSTLPADVRIETLGPEFDDGPDAFIDCAAVMSHLDLVVTSDTSIAHLAGALGRPTWLALKRVPEWRWQLDRQDSPWYPTMRLFRQDTDGDWKPVFARMELGLRERLSH